MGNSILEYSVFGRIAGLEAARRASKAKNGNLTLEHVKSFERMLKEELETKRQSPILLPEYRGKNVLSHMLDVL